MCNYHDEGCFPAPHSPALSVPEFMQELYAKINECVKAVNESNALVDEVLTKFGVLSDSIVEVGTANGWNWRKFSSGRVEATKMEEIDVTERLTYDGDKYTLEHDVPFPITLDVSSPKLWVQPCAAKMTSAVIFCTDTYAKIYLQANPFYTSTTCRVYYRLEGVAVEES